MKTFPNVIRTCVYTILSLACMSLRGNCEINERIINDTNHHKNELSNSKENIVMSSSSDIVRKGRSNEEVYLQNYSKPVELDLPTIGIKRANPVSTDTPVSGNGYEVSTAVTASTLSPSSPSTTSSKFDRHRSVPYSYFKILNPTQSHKEETSQQQVTDTPTLQIIVGVLLPFDGPRPFVVKKVSPAIERAVDKMATEMGPWNFYSLTVLYADSMCDIAEAMNQAIQLQERLKTSAFFGPVCDYAIAPVARQARFWNTPIITAGATAIDFYLYKNTTFSTLTRVGPANLQGCAEFIEAIVARYRWRRFKALYNSLGQDDSLFAFCHLLTEYLHYHMSYVDPKISMDMYKLDSGVLDDISDVFTRQVSTDYSESGTTSPAQHSGPGCLKNDVSKTDFSRLTTEEGTGC